MNDMNAMKVPALFALTLLISSACAAAPDPAPDHRAHMTVSGTARVEATPDQARFNVSVITEHERAQDALDANARSTAGVLDALRGAGDDDDQITTRGVRLSPNWSPRPRNAASDWQARIIGYRAENTLEVRTAALDRAGSLIASAVEAGANNVQGLSFRLEDDRAAREQAIARATERALHEAEVLARAAGVRRTRIVDLRLDGAGPQPLMMSAPMPMMARGMIMEDAMAAPPVEPGVIEVHASVTVTLAIEER